MKKTLEQLVLEEKRAYFKKWRAANKDRVKKYSAKYWEKRVGEKARELPQSEVGD